MGYIVDKVSFQRNNSTGKLTDGEIWIGSIPSEVFSVIANEHKGVFISCYIEKEHLANLARMNNRTEEDMLKEILPDKAYLQSGDFGEIFCRSVLQEWNDKPIIPTERWRNRSIKNDTVRGTDLVGYVISGNEPSEDDVLVFSEVKTRERGGDEEVVKKAYEGVLKDNTTRLANSLCLLQHSLLRDGKEEEADKFARFSSPYDNPYKKRLIACVVHNAQNWKDEYLQVLPEKHDLPDELLVVVINFADLSKWIDDFYGVAVAEHE